MIAILLSPIYIIVNIYIVKWLLKWTEACTPYFKNKHARYIIVSIYIFFASSFIIGFFLPVRLIKIIGNYWLGVVQYIVLSVIIADLIRLILIKSKKISNKFLSSKKAFFVSGLICFLFVGAISTYGVIHANKIIYTNYKVTVNKTIPNRDNLRIALISDLHLGYNSTIEHVKKYVSMINKLNPDLVVISGDIFDNSYSAIDSPDKVIEVLKSLKSTYGTYAVYGNHDIEEPILAGFTFSWKKNQGLSNPKMDEFLEKANITLIKDDSILIDDSFYLVGRLDYHKLGINIEARKTPEELLTALDKTKPIIVLDHEPVEITELSNNGADIDLSGHTHDGQMFPSNIFVKLFWPNPHGLIKENNLTSIVTSGVGVYGPNMRIGTTEEVVCIDINFKEASHE